MQHPQPPSRDGRASRHGHASRHDGVRGHDDVPRRAISRERDTRPGPGHSGGPDPSEQRSNGGDSSAPSTTIGPLSAEVLRPGRTMVGAQAGMMLLLAIAAVVLAITLLPRTLAGLGIIGATPATVTGVGSGQSTVPPDEAGQSTAPSVGSGGSGENGVMGSDGDAASNGGPAATGDPAQADGPGAPGNADGDEACALTPVEIAWGADKVASLDWCIDDGAAMPIVGDQVEIWVISGWDPVQARSLSGNVVLAIVWLLVLLGTGFGALIYGRQWWALRRATRSAVPCPELYGQIDRFIAQRGLFKKDARTRVRIKFGVPTSGGPEDAGSGTAGSDTAGSDTAGSDAAGSDAAEMGGEASDTTDTAGSGAAGSSTATSGDSDPDRGRPRGDPPTQGPTLAPSPYRPIFVLLPGVTDKSLLGAKLEVFPIGRTLRGRPAGPYVLRRIRFGDAPSGTLVGLGRAYRSMYG